MDEIEEIPLETAEGARPASTLGDRLVVGLAALALLGGVLIAGANLLDGLSDDAVAAASEEPRPSEEARPSRTPRPSPTPRPPREVTVVPGTPQPNPDEVSSLMGWLEVLRPTVLRAAPSDTADEMDQLAAGAVLFVYLEEPSGWAQAADSRRDGRTGWVQLAGADGEADAIFHPVDAEPHSGNIGGVWAGPSGMLALGFGPQTQYEQGAPFLLSSTDGERWTELEVEPALSFGGMQAAWGPSGWVAISTSPYSNSTWVWNSYDGRTWDPLGEMRTGSDSGWPNQIVASELGYMAVFDESRYNGPVPIAWFSADGITWQESVDPFARADATSTDGSTLRLLATDTGYLAWIMGYDPTPAAARVAFSADGLSWTELAIDPATVQGGLQLAVVGDSLLLLGQAPGGDGRVWRAEMARGTAMRLTRDTRLESALQGVVAPMLASDGQRAYLLAFEPPAGRPRILATDGASWRRIAVPEPSPFGPRPYIAAVTAAGLVLIGSRPTTAGDNPVFWHLRGDGSWVSETDPIVPMVPDPTPEECGAMPSTALEFAVLPPAWGPICFGDQPMTFTTWSAPCDWCDENQPPAQDETPWLMGSAGQLILRPAAGDPWPYRDAVLHPDLEPAVELSGVWIRVTGHFADPAASECTWQPEPGAQYYDPADQAVTYCRQRFVVTAVTLAEPPGWAASTLGVR